MIPADLREQGGSCECQFEIDPTDPDENGTLGNEPWHYLRYCFHCGRTWRGLHCPHDGYQKPCPHCGTTPKHPSEELT
jgi:hypothetical protein